MQTVEMTRFDARLPKQQKDFFEYAAKLGGFRSLTEFILSSVQEKAENIVEKHDKILASERDREIFFNALINPPEPNEALRNAALFYQEALEAKYKKKE